MAYIGVQDDLPGIRALLAFRPETARPLAELADVLLHQPGTLTPGEREMIAARVSYLNECTFCHTSHAAIASCHTGDDALVAGVQRDPETAPISGKLKALLAIAGRVQQSGRAVTREDIARARAEGATDVEIHDTVLIAAAFCMYNRYVDGLGTWTPTDPESYRASASLVAAHGYAASVPARPAAAPDGRGD